MFNRPLALLNCFGLGSGVDFYYRNAVLAPILRSRGKQDNLYLIIVFATEFMIATFSD